MDNIRSEQPGKATCPHLLHWQFLGAEVGFYCTKCNIRIR